MVTNEQITEEAVPIVATPIPIAQIDPSPLNRHSDDTDADIAELAQTIEENGTAGDTRSFSEKDAGEPSAC